MGQSIYSDPILVPAGPARVDPAQRRVGLYNLEARRRDLPGGWSDNRWEQVNHFKGVIYVAVRAVMDLVGGASYEVQRRRRPDRKRTTFGPGGRVAKSASGLQQGGHAEDYEPLDDWDFPLCRRVRCPNPQQTFGELMADVVLQNRLTGVGPLWVLGSAADPRKPAEMWAVKTPAMTPIYGVTRDYPQGAWRVTRPHGYGGPSVMAGGTTMTVPGEEIRRFLDPHPQIDWDGYSPLSAGGVQLDVLESVDRSRKSAMDQGVHLDTVVIAPGMTDPGIDAFKAKLEARHAGAENARRLAVLSPEPGVGDKFDVRTISSNAKDLDYGTGWDQMVKFVLALFGVPAAVANLSQAGGYAEFYAARQQFHDVQSAYLDRLAAWLTKVLAWPFSKRPGDLVVRIKPRPINDHELREKQIGRQLQYDLLTYNEARRLDDMDPVEGGDVPVSLFVKKKESELMPPEPPPGQPGRDGGDAGGGGGQDPMSAILGGDARPTSGAVPRPANPAAAGSLPPKVGKAMDTMTLSGGGALVRPAGGRRRKGRAKRFLARCLKSPGE
jgi:hypothetical protein